MNAVVRLTRRCNNQCVFCRATDACSVPCLDEDPARVLGRLRALRAGGARRVVLTGGEPTVTIALSLAVATARSLGFDEIAVKTNGRRLADGPYADRLVRGGLTHALVGLQSHLEEVHDALTRTPGSFAEATDGILALRTRGVSVTAVLALTQQNVGALRPYLDLVKALGVSAVTLQALTPAARRHALAAAVSVAPLAAAPDVHRALAYGESLGLRMTTVGIPRAVRQPDLRYYH